MNLKLWLKLWRLLSMMSPFTTQSILEVYMQLTKKGSCSQQIRWARSRNLVASCCVLRELSNLNHLQSRNYGFDLCKKIDRVSVHGNSFVIRKNSRYSLMGDYHPPPAIATGRAYLDIYTFHIVTHHPRHRAHLLMCRMPSIIPIK